MITSDSSINNNVPLQITLVKNTGGTHIMILFQIFYKKIQRRILDAIQQRWAALLITQKSTFISLI